MSRGRWDPEGFEAQTTQFVTGVKGGVVSFGYQGHCIPDVAKDVPVEHVRWFCWHAGRLTETRLCDGLRASRGRPRRRPSVLPGCSAFPRR